MISPSASISPEGWRAVRPEERAALAWSFGYFFCLLCGYYILRPLRDEMGIQGGVQALPWVFTATLLAMLAAVPLFGWASARLPRKRLLPAVYGFFLLNLLAFFGAFRAGAEAEWTARAFFVWVSVYNLFVVSVFWSFMVDLFDREQAPRLFGFIAAGGSAGALAGPALTATLVQPLGTINLLLVSAGFLALATLCIFRLLAWSTQRGGGQAPAEAPLGGGIWSGVAEVARSPYLLGIVGYMVLYTVLSTFLYLEQARLVADAGMASEARTTLFASMDLAVNLLALAGQAFATARLIHRLGVALALALVPALTLAGFGVLALVPVLGVVVGFQVLRRAADFAIARPARELLYTVVEREAKYKAKNFIDTVVYRSGDAAGGWAFAALKALGLGLAGIAWVAVPLAALWMALSVALGRRQAELSRQEAGNAERRSR
ncbi:MAG TPA: MFS transporter [Burkholderiales bacterium]|nr:MFS transporter [Burkholderiales bacterium]